MKEGAKMTVKMISASLLCTEMFAEAQLSAGHLTILRMFNYVNENNYQKPVYFLGGADYLFLENR